MIMEKGTLCILFLSGLCFLGSPLEQRRYLFINEPKTWLDAQQYCRGIFADLATVNNEQDLVVLAGLIEPGVHHIFLGLHGTWGWSRSDNDDNSRGEPAYLNWASGEPVRHYSCGSMAPTGEWFATDCSASLNFTCYNASTADPSQRFTWGSGPLNWLDAQAYCRYLLLDLPQVQNQLENEELQATVGDNQVWIGLTVTSWLWSDGSEPSFIPWRPSRPQSQGPNNCGALATETSPLGLEDVGCGAELPFLCYSAPERKHLMKLKLTTDHSVDIKAVMESVVNSVEGKLGEKGVSNGVKMSWWKPPMKENDPEQTTETPSVVCVP